LKIIVLYEELAWYFVNCLNVLAKNHDCAITVFCKKTNPNAPFQFNYIHPKIKFINRDEYSAIQLIEKTKLICPDAIFICGWTHKPYISLLKKAGIKNCVLGLDNLWSGSLKQIFGSVYFRISLKKYIKKAFVPGSLQYHFAKKLGFKDSFILKGAYCCDYSLFHKFYTQNQSLKKNSFPKRFLFVGRYETVKGIEILWSAFTELLEETKTDWELWCLGKGNVAPFQHPKIKHFGFMQQDELNTIIKNTGVFVLPSVFEPWGVVVHEYTTAGFPLICSDKVGANDTFLKEAVNGFSFKANDKKDLKNKLLKIIEMSDEGLNLMSENSAKISSSITPEIWASNFFNLLQNG
jgi:glycosyltransferase involved in cell wall biosynthesis